MKRIENKKILTAIWILLPIFSLCFCVKHNTPYIIPHNPSIDSSSTIKPTDNPADTTNNKPNEILWKQYNYNISYGKSKAQVMDLIFPDDPKNINKPLNAILLIHGGGWDGGDKSSYSEEMMGLSKGFYCIAITMNYRMFSDGADCDDMLADIDATLRLLKKIATESKITMNKVILKGGSAGGHLSLMYAYKKHSVSPIPIAFCVGRSAPTDFTDPTIYDTPEMLGSMLYSVSKLTEKKVTKDNYRSETNSILSVSPINYVTADCPPTILAHGTLDDTVPYSNAKRLYQALSKAGAKTNLFTYPNSGHGLNKDPDVDKKFNAMMLEYVNKYMK